MEIHGKNLKQWEASGEPRRWVERHNYTWNHDDWLSLLSSLEKSDYWPMNADDVGAVLEDLKRRCRFTIVRPGAAGQGASGIDPALVLDLGQGEGVQFVKVSPGIVTSHVHVYRVNITKEFWIAKYPVTQKQWELAMGTNPSHFRDDGTDCPVESVDFDDCQEFISRLNEKDSEWGYQLPTEWEWQLAYEQVGGGAADFWHMGNSGGRTHSVGEWPSPGGVDDMLGNVLEWCLNGDFSSTSAAGISQRILIEDPNPSFGQKALRGGYYLLEKGRITEHDRYHFRRREKSPIQGFRLIRRRRQEARIRENDHDHTAGVRWK